MTASQTERLVRKITEMLGQPPSDMQAAKLAEEYAEVCRAANRRLEQCALMIEAGQSLQALQLAETPPPLLDLITVLSFRQAAEWRSYCQAHQLPSSEPFYDKFVRLLNSAYGKGITSDHPYYRDYRRAVLKNDDERALSILRVISRMNPADQNTKAELQRVEEKLLRGKLDKLREIVAAGDKTAIVAELEKIENSGGPAPSSHPIWQRAQVARCQELLRRAGEFRQQDAWQDAEVLVEEIHTVASQNNVQLPATDADAWSSLEAWTTEKRGAYANNQDFQRTLSALEYEVQTAEAIRSKGRWLPRGEAQKKFNSLAARWDEAGRFGRPLDQNLGVRRQQCQDGLQKQIQSAKRRKSMAVGAVLLLILAGIGIAIPFVRNAAGERTLLQRLDTLESARQVSETRFLIAQVPDRLKAKPGVSEALAKAQDFIAREEKLKQTFDEDARALQQQAADGFRNNLGQIAPSLAQTEQALSQVAPEYQPGGQTVLNTWDDSWQSFRDSMLEKQLSREEQIAAGLNGGMGVDAVKAALARIQSLLAESQPYTVEPPVLNQQLKTRFRQLTETVALWNSHVEHWQQAQESLNHASSVDDYLQRLAQLMDSPFATDAQKDGAAEIDRLKINQSTLLGELLLPNDRSLWDSLTNASAWPATFMPGQPTSQEKNTYFKLRDDPNMENIYVYQLVTNRRVNNPFHTHLVFVRGVLARNQAGQMAGLVYDPDEFHDTAVFLPTTYSEWNYTDMIKSNRLAECESFDRLELGQLIDPNTGNYQVPILQLFDQLSRDDNSSPLFRAYVTLKLFDLAALHPDAWGMQWCPDAARHLQSLKDLGALDLKSGDWMVSAQIAKYGAAFNRYFQHARDIPLEKQAALLQQLAQQTCQTDFTYAGFIDINGNPVLRPINGGVPEYWGWGGPSRSVTLLLQKTGDQAAVEKVAESLPFTPLFVFNGDRRGLLNDTARAVAYPGNQMAGILPPFFSGLHE